MFYVDVSRGVFSSTLFLLIVFLFSGSVNSAAYLEQDLAALANDLLVAEYCDSSLCWTPGVTLWRGYRYDVPSYPLGVPVWYSSLQEAQDKVQTDAAGGAAFGLPVPVLLKDYCVAPVGGQFLGWVVTSGSVSPYLTYSVNCGKTKYGNPDLREGVFGAIFCPVGFYASSSFQKTNPGHCAKEPCPDGYAWAVKANSGKGACARLVLADNRLKGNYCQVERGNPVRPLMGVKAQELVMDLGFGEAFERATYNTERATWTSGGKNIFAGEFDVSGSFGASWAAREGLNNSFAKRLAT